MVENYIKSSWEKLLRNSLDVALDPKVSGTRRSFLYISPDENPAAINKAILERHKTTETLGAIEVKVLPEDFIVTEDHGILYLPHSYIVPGGRFNEMYAWDSYWIVRGLLEDGYHEIAQGIVENFIYQIEHYGGKVLNANRTYYLSRSQPPMHAAAARALLPFVKEGERVDFLKRVTEAISSEYEEFWKTSRYDKERGLFHYGNIEQGSLGLCPEVAFGERDENGLSHYDKINTYLKNLPVTDLLRIRFLDETTGSMTHEAIAGDRAMRESGFDVSMQMGYFGLETLDFNPVCLNSLLYVQCKALAEMYQELNEAGRAKYFLFEAEQLHANINKYMWNEETKLFAGYNHLLSRHSPFPYLTSAYPLWAGIATPEQAAHFRNNLPLFETEFGIRSTDQQTGCQWDSPFMWAPLVYFTIFGLQNYGFIDDARRIAQKFVDTVMRVNEIAGANFEKYNAFTGDCRTDNMIDVGYSENVVGFGWTNGTVLILRKWLQATAPSSAHSLDDALVQDRV